MSLRTTGLPPTEYRPSLRSLSRNRRLRYWLCMRGHACRVGVPSHQVAHRRALAHQVLAHHARPRQIVRAQHLESTGHLAGPQVARLGHLRLQQADLGLVDEEAELAGLGEIGLRGKQRDGGEPRIAIARHGRRRDRQQRPAQPIAGRVHRPARHDAACIARGVAMDCLPMPCGQHRCLALNERKRTAAQAAAARGCTAAHAGADARIRHRLH